MSPYFMAQSEKYPGHTAIIMDGNGRWAAARGLHRLAGHHAGANAIRPVVEAAPALGIETLTLYAFSSDNWRRPRDEVAALFALLAQQLSLEAVHCREKGVRISMIGRRDRLPDLVTSAAALAERMTRNGTRLHLRLAIDYSSRDAIVCAASRAASLTSEEFSRRMGSDVDLLIRTGGEQRLSDFLLWESAYAELVFVSRMWPDFEASDLERAVRVFKTRERRFGCVSQPPCPEQPPHLGQAHLGQAHLGQAHLRQSSTSDEAGLLSHLRGDRWLR